MRWGHYSVYHNAGDQIAQKVKTELTTWRSLLSSTTVTLTERWDETLAECMRGWEVLWLESKGSQAGDLEELKLQVTSEGSLLAEFCLARGKLAFCSSWALI